MADNTVVSELWQRMTEALGLPADADAETVVLAVEDLVTTPEPSAEKVAAAAGLDPATLTQLRHDAEQGRILAAAARRREITDIIDAALQRGAILPHRRQHWLAVIEADPIQADTLASLPEGFAVSLKEIGYASDPDDGLVEQAAWFH